MELKLERLYFFQIIGSKAYPSKARAVGLFSEWKGYDTLSKAANFLKEHEQGIEAEWRAYGGLQDVDLPDEFEHACGLLLSCFREMVRRRLESQQRKMDSQQGRPSDKHPTFKPVVGHRKATDLTKYK